MDKTTTGVGHPNIYTGQISFRTCGGIKHSARLGRHSCLPTQTAATPEKSLDVLLRLVQIGSPHTQVQSLQMTSHPSFKKPEKILTPAKINAAAGLICAPSQRLDGAGEGESWRPVKEQSSRPVVQI